MVVTLQTWPNNVSQSYLVSKFCIPSFSPQVLKMYAWEKPFQAVVKAARAYEMRALWRSVFVRSTFLNFMLFTERTILFITILMLILTDNMITAETVNIVIDILSCTMEKVTVTFNWIPLK